MGDDPRYLQAHPYDQKGVDRDYWIDRFRSVFRPDSDDAQKVLMFLGHHWHFFDRRLPCEEWSVQRQCFIDLLICLGVWDPDVWGQGLAGLVQPARMTVPGRIRQWFVRLLHLRTARVKKEGQKEGRNP